MTTKPITIAAIGLDHRHIYTMVGNLLAAGAVCKGFWTDGEPERWPASFSAIPTFHGSPSANGCSTIRTST